MAERFGDYDNEWLDILGNMEQNIRKARGTFIKYKREHRYYWTPSRLCRIGITGTNLWWKCNEV